MTEELDTSTGKQYHFYHKDGMRCTFTILGQDGPFISYCFTDNEERYTGLPNSIAPHAIQHNLRFMVKNAAAENPTLSRQKVFALHVDPGHGWLKVRQDDLIALGIANNISAYSYRRGIYAYLEEDRDAVIFVDAYRKTTGREPMCRHRHADRRSRIRDYDMFASPLTGESYHDEARLS